MGVTLGLVALAPLRTSAPTSLAFDAAVVRRSAPLAVEDGGAGVLGALTDAATAVRDLAGDTLREAATVGAREASVVARFQARSCSCLSSAREDRRSGLALL